MARYVIGHRPEALGRYENEPMIPVVCAPESVPVATGLFDARGNEIWRLPNPMGFGRDEEWA